MNHFCGVGAARSGRMTAMQGLECQIAVQPEALFRSRSCRCERGFEPMNRRVSEDKNKFQIAPQREGTE